MLKIKLQHFIGLVKSLCLCMISFYLSGVCLISAFTWGRYYNNLFIDYAIFSGLFFLGIISIALTVFFIVGIINQLTSLTQNQ